MTQVRLNRFGAAVPLVCSALAFAIVMANILAGMPPQADENASAHLWQLLMAAQVPLIILFAVTANWRRWPAAIVLGAQLLGIALACVPVWRAGY